MRIHRRGVRAISLSIVAVLVGLIPAAAAAGPRSEVHRVSLGPSMTVEAPPAGYGVAANAVLVSGGHLGVVLETDIDGVTRDVTDDETVASAARGPGRIASSPSACSDDRYNLLSMKWNGAWTWSFNARSTPTGDITKARAESALKSAVASITGERNDCGRPDQVSATTSYQGRTAAKPGVTSVAGCRRHMDGKSVVGFGDLPTGVLALTCTVFQRLPGIDNSVESDVLFNKAGFRWTTQLAGCTNRIVLRSVATHEFGHVFGLNHVAEASHGKLTMSTAIGPCDDSAFTLGKGDMLGLEQRY